jgi:ribosome-binding factor A
MPSGIRLKRINDQMQRILTALLESKVNDPRVQDAYITDVSVDRELDYANIYVSSLAGKEQAEEILEGLRSASGFLRYAISQEMTLRVMPRLRFHWDDTPEKADRVEELLAQIREERDENPDDEDAADIAEEEDLNDESDG